MVFWWVLHGFRFAACMVRAKELAIFGSRLSLAEEQQKEYRIGSEFTHNNQINQDAQLKAAL